MPLVSPNDIQKAACDHMLEGRAPATTLEWELCANFWAANIKRGLEVACVPLLGSILDCPLSRAELLIIAEYQAAAKGAYQC